MNYNELVELGRQITKRPSYLRQQIRLSRKASEPTVRKMTAQEHETFNIIALASPLNRSLPVLKYLNPTIETLESSLI